MKILKFKNYDAVSKHAAQIVINQINKKPNTILGLATGSSPIGLYNNLIEAYQLDTISFKEVKTFNLDEYIGIPKDHPQSYYSFMFEHLFNHVDIKMENINIPSNQGDRIDTLAEEYNQKLFGNQRDLQILGIGENAHIGFNEPGSNLSNQTFIVELDNQTREANARFFDSIDEVPTKAVTMGIKNIMYSKKIILIATGLSKAEAIYKTVYGPITKSVPSSILQLHPNVTILVDEDAASKLDMTADTLSF